MKGGRRQPLWERGGGNPEREGLQEPVPRPYSAVARVAGSQDKQASLSPKPHFLTVHSFLSCPTQCLSILVYTHFLQYKFLHLSLRPEDPLPPE